MVAMIVGGNGGGNGGSNDGGNDGDGGGGGGGGDVVDHLPLKQQHDEDEPIACR